MDLEISDVPLELRPQCKKRLVSYKHEQERLKKEFVGFIYLLYSCSDVVVITNVIIVNVLFHIASSSGFHW